MSEFIIPSFANVSSLPDLFFSQADRLGSYPFLWEKTDGAWLSLSYAQAAETIENMAIGLKKLGLKKGQRVVLLSENCPRWVLSDLAIMLAGGITVPAYITNTTANNLYLIADSGATMAIISTRGKASELITSDKQPQFDAVITLETADGASANTSEENTNFISFDQCNALGKAEKAQGNGANCRDMLASLKRNETACLIYTSGTGGNPRGVITTHGAILANIEGAHAVLAKLPNYGKERETFLNFLPLSHAYEHTAGQFFPIGIGGEIYFSEGLEHLVTNMAEVSPTIMTAVPRLYETIRRKILRGGEQAGGLKYKLLQKTLEIGAKKTTQQPLSTIEKMLDPALTYLVRRKVARRFGGRLKTFVSGGAPLNYDVGVFFMSLGIRILQGYGQTEAAPVISVNLPENNQLDTVGPPLKNIEVRLAPDGEICVRGEMVMVGYWKNEAATAQTIKDGWLHTGDIGEIQDDGFLRITDRKKDIIVNSGGDTISPQKIEGMINLQAPFVQSLVFGDQRANLVALVVVDDDFTQNWKENNAKFSTTETENSDINAPSKDMDQAYLEFLQKTIHMVNQDLSVIEKIRRFTIIDEPFSIENGMLTPTLKIRRHVVVEKYQKELDSLYGQA